MKKNRRNEKIRNYIVRYFFIIVWVIIALLPIYSALMTSLTPFAKLGERMLYPKYFHWENYIEVATQTPLWEYLKASIIYALGTSFLQLLFRFWQRMHFPDFNFGLKWHL